MQCAGQGRESSACEAPPGYCLTRYVSLVFSELKSM